MTKAQTAAKVEAIERLREIIKPGDTVYTVLRHVARSGMSRRIDAYVMANGEPRWVSGYVATACGIRLDKKHDGIVIGGCGMDMGFAIVYDLSATLYPGGFTCIGEPCGANDHSNGDRNRKPHTHRDGGYALRHRWM